MARLNARRRRAIKLQAALIELAKHKNPSTVAAQGPLRSSHKAALLATQRFHAPRPVNFDKAGTRGRVENGKLKPRMGRKLWGAT